MMYFAWTRHGVSPSVIFSMPPGERLVVRAFMEHEREEMRAALGRQQQVFPVVDILRLGR